MQRTVFFVSESTGITAETLGQSLLSQFAHAVDFRKLYRPFVSSPEKAEELCNEIKSAAIADGAQPIVIATLAQPSIGEVFERAPCLYIEAFSHFLGVIGEELGVEACGKSGLSHGIANSEKYEDRIRVINYSMASDDGMGLDHLDEASVILVGVSRSGKTPTSLYLAMHFGLPVANYPLTEEDFDRGGMPPEVMAHKQKLVGLSIQPERLHCIRDERRPGSRYAALATCHAEVRQAEQLFRRLGVRVFDTTNQSIEEIASQIYKEFGPG